jgi:iron complex outermembrane receptor protein
MLNLPGGLTLDVWGRFVDGLAYEDVEEYFTMDMRLGYLINSKMELSVTGQNLVDSSRMEYIPQFLDTTPTEVERSVYGKVIWRF